LVTYGYKFQFGEANEMGRVDNIDEAIHNSVEMGAQVVREKMEFDTFYLAYLVDPVGNGIGLIQNK
jgi:predicted enzyme related to lactoylglutathione lyase